MSEEFCNQKLLLIDDEPDNLALLSAYLEDYRFHIVTALSGDEGLEVARRELPSLILLDIMMPGTDGFEVCRQLKKDGCTAHIPVIFLSACNTPEHKRQGFSLGAADYIIKPVHRDELLARVTAHLNQKKLHDNLLQRLNAYQTRFGVLPDEEKDSAAEEVSRHRLHKINQAREILVRDLSNPPTLECLAKTLATNRRKLSEDFQCVFGMSIFTWLHEYRLQEGCKLLRDSNITIGQIALTLGYAGTANFSTAFKQRFGVSPRVYRKAQTLLSCRKNETI